MLSITRAKLTGKIFMGVGGRGGSNLLVMGSCEGHCFFLGFCYKSSGRLILAKNIWRDFFEVDKKRWVVCAIYQDLS